AFYTTAVGALDAVDPVAETATRTDRQLGDGLTALTELAAAKESVALERGLLNGVFAEGAFHDREYLISKVAASLRQVEHTALHLAAQQAGLRRNTTESLANLGRRNQNLVRRQ